jgi:glycosyltransferase involved in cell wall biosynthesis
MKVLIVTALYPPAVGGAATYFGDIVPELIQRDGIEELILLTEHMPGQPREWIEGRLRLLRYLPTRISLPQRRWLTHALTYVLTQLWFAARLPGLVRRHRVDLIHFHTRYRGRLFYAALRRSRVPVLADLRDKMTAPARLAAVAGRLLCCGEGVQRFAIEKGFPSEQMALIPTVFTPPEIPSSELVSDARQRYGLGEGPYLLFVGDITYNKGVYDLLEAYRRWQSGHPRVRLVFAGINREGERFLRQVRQVGEAIYLGHVPHRDALILMRGAEVVLLPSRTEGLPRVILEAVALGTRVICPPGIPEFERYLPQFALPSVDADSIVKTLSVVWYDNTLPSYPLSQHSVNRVVEDLANVYSEVMREEVR